MVAPREKQKGRELAPSGFWKFSNIDMYIIVRFAAIDARKMQCPVTAVQLLLNSQYGKKL